jgi:hypothetical protein
MLRLLYRCLLRLHPPGFRTRFAEEMLSIFEHAAGPASTLRLLLDGLVSLALQWTLRREFWHDLPALAPQSAPDGVPSFHTIAPFRPRTAAVIHGLALSTAVFCLTCFAIRYSWIHVLHVRIREVQWDSPRPIPSSSGPAAKAMTDTDIDKPHVPPPTEHNRAIAPAAPPATSQGARPSPAPAPAIQNSEAHSSATLSPATRGAATRGAATRGAATRGAAMLASETPGSKSQARWEERSGRSREMSNTAPVAQARMRSNARTPVAQAQVLQTNSQDATSAGAVLPAASDDAKLDARARHAVIDGAIANLQEYYVDPQVAQNMADALQAHENNGDNKAATDGAAFADLLTSQMRAVSHDRHLMVVYDRAKAPERPPGPSAQDLVRYRRDMQRTNCTVESVKILPHNIGYLKFSEFPDPSVCQPTVVAAMNRLRHADAIIFDLRDNHGGSPDMVAMIATYLFDRPTHLNDIYDRSVGATQQYWTQPPVPGNRLADKPAYVLTSASTFSGAEEFSYDLKMLKRATLVGETTSGRGHMGSAHRIDDHFEIRVPDRRAINPISKTNWEGTGVEPDVRVKAADALKTAETLAASKLQKK